MIIFLGSNNTIAQEYNVEGNVEVQVYGIGGKDPEEVILMCMELGCNARELVTTYYPETEYEQIATSEHICDYMGGQYQNGTCNL